MLITECNSKEFTRRVLKDIKPIVTLLDIGCGIKPCNIIPNKKHICCEPYKEYVDVLNNKYPDLEVLNIGWEEVVKRFDKNSVDTVAILNVIEHLEKDKGRELLEKTLKIAKQQVIILTPLGFFEQKNIDGMDGWGMHGGEWQTHRSGWIPEDFPTLENGSWKFYVCNNLTKKCNKEKDFEKPASAFWAVWTWNI